MDIRRPFPLCEDCASLPRDLRGENALPCPDCAQPYQNALGLKIVDVEARRSRSGRIQIYNIPSGDGGGRYEVAGINSRYHPEEVEKLVRMIQGNDAAGAELEAARYIEEYTARVEKWGVLPTAVVFFLRDCCFNRGPAGAAKILQIALGYTKNKGVDGDIGPNTRHQITVKISRDEHGEDLLLRLLLARQTYETEWVGRPHDNKFRDGLENRWLEVYRWSRLIQRNVEF